MTDKNKTDNAEKALAVVTETSHSTRDQEIDAIEILRSLDDTETHPAPDASVLDHRPRLSLTLFSSREHTNDEREMRNEK